MHTMMEKCFRLVPLIRPELPSLPSGHHANHTIPSVCTKFRKRLHTIDDEVPSLYLSLFSARVDGSPFAVYGE